MSLNIEMIKKITFLKKIFSKKVHSLIIMDINKMLSLKIESSFSWYCYKKRSEVRHRSF